MRDLITGLAIIVIVVLTAALAAPYFIDWNGQRSFLEARLSHALGQKVTIGGGIDLKLLPAPYLVLGQTVIGSDDGPITLGIRHLDLELSIAPLLHGEFEFVDANLREPTLRVTLERDRTLPALPPAPAFRADVSFDRISVSDGTLAVADPESGHTYVFDNLDFDAEAPSLSGPFKGGGAAGSRARRTKFRFGTTTAQDGRARARLVLDETPAHAGLELDGVVTLAGAGRDTVSPSFDGSVVVVGHVSTAADEPVAWTLSGPLKADPQRAALAGGALRVGSEDAGVTLQADGEGDFGKAPAVHVNLAAKQLDIDRLSGAPPDAGKPQPPRLPDLPTLRRILKDVTPPIPAALDLAVETATYGADTLSNLEAHLGIDASDRKTLKVSGDGPGGLHLGVAGAITPAADRGFDGTVDVAADDLPHALDWLASIDPAMTLKAADIPFRAVKVSGRVVAGETALEATGLALELDRSALAGTARLAFADTSQPAKVTADLNTQVLDLDTLPALRTLRAGMSPLDLDLRLDAKAIKVARVGDSSLEAGHVRLGLSKAGRNIDLKAFQADDLGGASIAATGALDTKGAKLAMTIDAARLEEAAALVRQLAPGAATDALVSRAPVLGPARLKLDAAFAATDDGALSPSRLTLAGQLGATKVDAVLAPEAGDATSIALHATADAPEGGVLLRQLGLATMPAARIGASRLTLTARGVAMDQPLDTRVQASLGTTQVEVAGRFSLLAAVPAGTGAATLKSADANPLLQSLALAHGVKDRVPADVTGGLTIGQDEVALANLKGRVDDTGVSGDVRWKKASADAPVVTGSLAVDHMKLATLFALAVGPPQPVARSATWSSAPFAAGLLDPPRAAIVLKVKTLDLMPNVVAEDALLDLGLAPNAVTMHNLSARLEAGRLGADMMMRRDGAQATLEGKLALEAVQVGLPSLGGKLSATLDLAGSGSSALGLVSSLAGSGAATLAGTTMPDADPRALRKVFDDVENDNLAVDEDSIIRALDEAAKAPLYAGTRSFGLSLAAGVLHFDPKDADQPDIQPVTSKLDASLDLRAATLETHVEQTLHALPKNWTGPEPTVVVARAGPLKDPQRSYDVSTLINAVATRALARESARIEAYEFDVRERAFFNQRLQSERRREQDRIKAEDDARRAEAERKARAEAARLERARRDAEATARAEQEKALQDKINADQAAKERAPEPSRASPANAQPPADTRRFDTPQPGSGGDPSAAGRY